MSLVFNEEAHAYSWNGKSVPSVTQILSPLYNFDMVSKEVLAAKSYLGTCVHLATELYDQGDLDEDALAPEIRPYLDAWIKFRHEAGFEPLRIEARVFHPIHQYAGTLDRTGYCGDSFEMVDIKTCAAVDPAAGVQTAAYCEAYVKTFPTDPKPTRRRIVQLRPDGTYRAPYMEDKNDWPTFLSLLTIHNYIKRHGKSVNFC